MELALFANLFVFLGTFVAGFTSAYDSAVADNASSNDTTDDGFANDQAGTSGNDTVTALRDNTFFLLGDGDDVLGGGSGNDSLYGQSGADSHQQSGDLAKVTISHFHPNAAQLAKIPR